MTRGEPRAVLDERVCPGASRAAAEAAAGVSPAAVHRSSASRQAPDATPASNRPEDSPARIGALACGPEHGALSSPADDSAVSHYLPMPARIVSVESLTRVEKLFALTREDGRPLGHQPGQFVQVSILGVGECPISLCSSPTRPDTFELCIRRVGEVTGFLHALQRGDMVGIRGPLGRGFDVDDMHGRDILIVAGGLGLAPVRSLIHLILDRRERFGAFHVLYGARSPAELLFRDDLLRWREDPRVNCHVTVDRPDEQWRGRRGVVTTLFKELPPLDPARTTAVIVGPPVMFKFVVLEVLARRIAQKDIYCSLERRMKCGIGRCGHCQANNVYVCTEGPVFRYGQLKALREALE